VGRGGVLELRRLDAGGCGIVLEAVVASAPVEPGSDDLGAGGQDDGKVGQRGSPCASILPLLRRRHRNLPELILNWSHFRGDASASGTHHTYNSGHAPEVAWYLPDEDPKEL
jgi:hypothetical protein